MTTRSWPRPLAVAAALAGIAVVAGTADLPANAGSLYLDVGVGGGAMSFKVESFQEQKYRNTIAQEHDFSCGSAALATLLSYNYNIAVSETDVFKDMIVNGDKKTISELGFSLLDIKRYLQRRGLDSNGFRAPLAKLEEVRLPAIVLLNVRGYRHFVVLEGIGNRRVLLADPANGMRSEPIGVFEAEWSGIFFLITSDVAQGQKSFNSDQKWAAAPGPPWVSDPLRARSCDIGPTGSSEPVPVLKKCVPPEGKVTCQLKLLAAVVATAASLLGGCSDNTINAGGSAARAPILTATADPPSRQAAAKKPTAPVASSPDVEKRLASVALDDARLSDIRGGFDAGSGVTLNFAFQQATFVNHNLTENVVVPTLTISPGQGSLAGSGAIAGAVHPSVGVGSLVGLGIAGAPSATGVAAGINSATVVANGAVQTQVSVSTATLQALVNSGIASVIGPAGPGGNNGGVTSTITNTANNQLIQQMTTVDIGVSGLSKLMQQSVPTAVMSRLSGPNGFR